MLMTSILIGLVDICKRSGCHLIGAKLVRGPVSQCETGQFGGDLAGAHSIATLDVCAGLAEESEQQPLVQAKKRLISYRLITKIKCATSRTRYFTKM